MTEPRKKSGKSGRAILVVVLATVALSVGIGFGPDIVQKFREDGIMESGLSATGEILEVVDTGNRYNSNPEVEILLEITAANGKTWQARTRKVLSAVDLMSHQPGTRVRVMYDPEDPSRVVLLGPM
jgi:hypothetical protein